MKDMIYRQDAIDALKNFEEQCMEDACYIPPMSDARIIIGDMSSAEPDPAHDIMDFARYQVAWLESHNDIVLEPELEKWMVRMLYDTAECYIMEHPCTESQRESVKDVSDIRVGRWVNNIHDIPICDQCGYMTPYDRAIDDYEYGNYCPNCGAKMEVEK